MPNQNFSLNPYRLIADLSHEDLMGAFCILEYATPIWGHTFTVNNSITQNAATKKEFVCFIDKKAIKFPLNYCENCILKNPSIDVIMITSKNQKKENAFS